MSVYITHNFDEIRNFNSQSDQLFIIERKIPEGADIFFKKIIKTNLTVIGEISKKNTLEDIKNILDDEIPQEVYYNPFYNKWIKDMALIGSVFCDLQ